MRGDYSKHTAIRWLSCDVLSLGCALASKKRESFSFLLGSAIVTGCESSPFRSSVSISLRFLFISWLPGWLSRSRIRLQCRSCRRLRFSPRVRKIPWRRNGNPLQYSCLENTMNRGAWRTTVHTVAKSQTQLSMHTRAGSLDGKESACNAGHPGLTPASGRFPGEGNGCPLLYCLPSAFCSLLFMTPQRILNSSLQPMDEPLGHYCKSLSWKKTYSCCQSFPKAQSQGNGIKLGSLGASLVVQQLTRHTPSAGGPNSIPSQGIRSHTPQLRAHTPQLKTLRTTTNIKDLACHN